MTPLQVLFLLIAAGVLGSALLVVTTRNLVHAAMWLVASLFGVAVVFVLLEATFLAVAQVVVYIGAIAILFIFAVMLTRRLMQDSGPQTNATWWLAAIISAMFFAGLTWMVATWDGFRSPAASLPLGGDTIQTLGAALVSPDGYVLPFELASVLLLAALIGAIVVASDNP